MIEVIDWGPFWRATCWVDVRPGSPYRAMFVSGQARVTKWGMTPESAAERCRRRVKKVKANDERMWQEEQARTKRYSL